jgi:4-amino-4-deoxy-L-arabinose transferase-like glycosyltransferase
MWTSWPVLFEKQRPTGPLLPGWHGNIIEYIHAFWREFQSIERLTFLIRYPNMLLSILLLTFVYRWTKEWSGELGGLLAVLIFTWDPTLVAHAQLNTTDLGITLFIFVACYLIERLRLGFSYSKILGAAIMTGAAVGTKASGLMFLPIAALLIGINVFERYENEPFRWWFRECLRQIVLFGGISLLFLWMTYSFEWDNLPKTGVSLPLATHIRMVRIFLKGRNRLAFANGQLKLGGWWWYFPFAFLIKTPIPLITAYGATTLKIIKTIKHFLLKERNLWVFPLLYLVVSIYSGVNIGYRHLLPIFPFAYVAGGKLAEDLLLSQFPKQPIKTFIILILVGWYIGGTLNVAPFYIAYFNEFIGGPSKGYKYLVDSNVAWGQSFKALNQYMENENIESVHLSYSTWINPEVYGVSYEPLFPSPRTTSFMPRRYDPAPGVYAISATTLQGIALKEHDPDLYEWFRNQKPDAQPGYGINVYHVKPHDPPATWIAQCNTPVVALPTYAITQGFGNNNLREVHFDCTQSWIYPTGGEFSGWYSLHDYIRQDPSFIMQDFLEESQLSYQQEVFRELPAFALYAWNNKPLTNLDDVQTTAIAAPITWPPEKATKGGRLIHTPVEMNGPLTFQGYHFKPPRLKPGRIIHLYTIWKVRSRPQNPLSIIGHIVDAEGKPIDVADGLGVPIHQWEQGDIIVQNHSLVIPHDIVPGTYWLQTGAYWLETLDRWIISPSKYDRLLLEGIEIR